MLNYNRNYFYKDPLKDANNNLSLNFRTLFSSYSKYHFEISIASKYNSIYYCNKDLLKPTPNPNPHPEAKMIGGVDQDILNCLIYKRILQKKLNSNFPIYAFNWRAIRMDNYYLLKNKELVEYLDNSENTK